MLQCPQWACGPRKTRRPDAPSARREGTDFGDALKVSEGLAKICALPRPRRGVRAPIFAIPSRGLRASQNTAPSRALGEARRHMCRCPQGAWWIRKTLQPHAPSARREGTFFVSMPKGPGGIAKHGTRTRPRRGVRAHVLRRPQRGLMGLAKHDTLRRPRAPSTRHVCRCPQGA